MHSILLNHGLFIANILVAGLCTVYFCRLGPMGLISWVTTQGILANIFVLKQIELFGINVTAADVFTISVMFSLILLQEIYDKEMAKLATKVSLLSLLFFSIISQLHLHYVPSTVDFAQPAYKILFGPNFRIIIASIVAYYISMRFNIMLYDYFGRKFAQYNMALRATTAVMIAQVVDTVAFGFLGLYGVIDKLATIILFSTIIKLISTLFLSYVSVLAKKYNKFLLTE